MDGNAPVNAEELATPAIETQEPAIVKPEIKPDPKDEPIDLDAPQEEEDAPLAAESEVEEPAVIEPEFAEIEVNGKKYNVPPELKDGFLMQADYTRKTQEVAEIRKAAEARAAEADQVYNTSQEVLEARAHLMNVDSKMKQYQEMNWQAYENEDPVAAMSAWREFQQLKEVRGNIGGFLDRQQKEMSDRAAQDTDKRLRETRAFAEKEIPNWTPELDTEITKFAESKGFSRETLLNAYSPPVYNMLFLAMLGSKALSKQQSAPKATAIPVQPLRTVSAKSSPNVTKNPADMSMDEYAAWSDKKFNKR